YVGFEKAADGVRVEVPKERLALQAKGLALLERLSCPLIVGDYPDMTGADRRMLHEMQIPDRDTLAKLNENLRQWAQKRGKVHVFPLSEFVAGAKQRGLPVSLGGREVLLPPRA